MAEIHAAIPTKEIWAGSWRDTIKIFARPQPGKPGRIDLGVMVCPLKKALAMGTAALLEEFGEQQHG